MVRINATGCALLDILYDKIDFSSKDFLPALAKEEGDGGMTVGGLVFIESLCSFTGRTAEEMIDILTGGEEPAALGIGGPGIVAMIHAMQMNSSSNILYRFSGVLGSGQAGERMRELLSRIDLSTDDWKISDEPSPQTIVFSDPQYDNGRGERSFVIESGALNSFSRESLPSDFFDADILYFGATALLPVLHSRLDNLLRLGREKGTFNLVGTVYDYANEEKFPGEPWPLVNDYTNIDLLVTDREEALKITRKSGVEEALSFFVEKGCGAVIITQGKGDVLFAVGNKERFVIPKISFLPTSRYADKKVAGLKCPHDTTGCGDNFLGGVIDALSKHFDKKGPDKKIDLEELVIEGVAAGSYALGLVGGVDFSLGLNRGEKEVFISEYRNSYLEQIGRK